MHLLTGTEWLRSVLHGWTKVTPDSLDQIQEVMKYTSKEEQMKEMSQKDISAV